MSAQSWSVCGVKHAMKVNCFVIVTWFINNAHGTKISEYKTGKCD